jgi:molybdopterin-guanine dinucleotide biosynthesis protein A
MSAPKAGLLIGGRSILDRELDVLTGLLRDTVVVSRPGGGHDTGRAEIITDPPEFDGLSGPLKGIYAALQKAGGRSVFAVGCDMPFIRPELVSYMISLSDGANAVVPVVDGYREPLFAIYPGLAAKAAHSLLVSGRMKLTDILDGLDVTEVGEDTLRLYDPELVSFTNVNTPEELERARIMAAGLTGADRRSGRAVRYIQSGAAS